jgi:hypothetical protein
MRFDTPIYFQRIKSEYDATTGNSGISIISEVKRYASVTSTGVQTLNLVYGGIKQGSLTIRLQNHYSEPFDRIRIGDKYYRVDTARPLRLKYSLIVSEVQ